MKGDFLDVDNNNKIDQNGSTHSIICWAQLTKTPCVENVLVKLIIVHIKNIALQSSTAQEYGPSESNCTRIWPFRVQLHKNIALQSPTAQEYRTSEFNCTTVRSGAEERTFWGARLDVLIFRLRSYHVLIMYSAECDGPKFYKTLMFLGQAGMFLSFQARRSSAMRSSTSDLTVVMIMRVILKRAMCSLPKLHFFQSKVI